MKILPLLILSLLAFNLQSQDTATQTFYTMAYLEVKRDIEIPIKIERLNNKLRIWKENLGTDWETEWPQFKETIFGLEKDQKTTLTILQNLRDSLFIAQKTKVEVAFKKHLFKDQKYVEKYSNLWDRIKNLAEERSQQEINEQFHSTGGLALLDAAVNIVLSCHPNITKENRKRAIKTLENYTSMSNGYPLSDNFFGRAFFVDHFNRALGWLDHIDPLFTKVFRGKNGAQFLEAVYGDTNGYAIGSLVAHAAQRDSLVSLGWNAIQRSEDPAIIAARELVILMHENKKAGKKLDKREEVLRKELGMAFFDVYGVEVVVNF